MPPAGGETGSKNADLTADLVIWNRAEKTGKVFDSSTGFVLPNGAKRSPDASWIPIAEWESLSSKSAKSFCRFVLILSLSCAHGQTAWSAVQKKMQEYMENGARLGWLLDPQSRRVEIYRPDQEVEILDAPKSLSGEGVLPGFTLNLAGILTAE